MNASVYIFGEFNSGYTQYPDDYAASIFQKFAANAKSTTQIAIHRDGNLVYYGYIRKLQQEKYIGLCVVLNGLVLKRIEGLFSLYENTISTLVTRGMLINFNDQGDLVTSVERLYLNREEIELLTESLRAGFNRFESSLAQLPAVSYGTSKDSNKDFVIDDDIADIIKSSYTNGYTYIYKSKGYNTAQLNSYKGVLTKVNKEKIELQKKLEVLQKEHTKTLKQKKQFKFVLILFVILFGCAIGLISLNDNLKNTKSALSNANDTISMQNDSLVEKSTQISNLHEENTELDQRRQEAEDNLENLKNKIGNRQPFIIKSTSFSFSSGYLSFDYYGMISGTVEIQVRAYNDNGESYSNSTSVSISEGDNSARVYLNDCLDSQKWYSFEILKGNIILGGDRHKLTFKNYSLR